MKLMRRGTLILLTTLAVASAAWSRDWDSVKGSFDRTLTVTGAVDLEVRTGSGDIKVHAGPSGKVTIHGKIQARNDGSSAEEKVKYLEAHPPEPARSSTSTPPPRTLPRMEPCPTVPVTVTGKPVEISPELVWASSSNPRSEGKCTRIWPEPVSTRHSPVGLPSAVMSPAPVRSSSVP